MTALGTPLTSSKSIPSRVLQRNPSNPSLFGWRLSSWGHQWPSTPWPKLQESSTTGGSTLTYLGLGVMIQPPFFIFRPLPKLFPLRHPHQLPNQHMHSKHQFDASPLPTSLYRLHHRLWIYAHPVHLAPPSPTSCPRQTSLTLWTLTCRPHPIPPKPSTFGKPLTAPRSMPLRPEIEPHHRCPWKQSRSASHVVAKHATPLPHPSHPPCATTVHHQKHLVHATTLRIPTTTAKTLPTRSTNTITEKHTVSTSCRHPRIEPL